MRVGLIQLNGSDAPATNLVQMEQMIAEAAADGAELVATPEVCNCISTNRSHQNAVLQHEEDDETLAALRAGAKQNGIWLLIGSIGLKTSDADGARCTRNT